MKKECRLCKIEKSQNQDFYKKRNGFDNRCKDCLSKLSRDRYRNDIERQRERSRVRWKTFNSEQKDVYRKRKKEWDKTKSGRYHFYIQNSRKRNINFELTREQFKELIDKNCTYCGEYSKGVDRVNNSIGYTVNNSVPCCGTCNLMKRAMSVDEFIEQCRKILKYSSKEQLDDYWKDYK